MLFSKIPQVLCMYMVAGDWCLPWHCLVMNVSQHLCGSKHSKFMDLDVLSQYHSRPSSGCWKPNIYMFDIFYFACL
jgi:hypothetical protein